MDKNDVKSAMKAIYEANNQGFPSTSIDGLIEIAAQKVFYGHGWSTSKKVQSISGAVGSYKFELDNGDYKSYAGSAYKVVDTGTLPFTILSESEFDDRYGDVSQLGNGATYYGKISWDADNLKWYLWTERPMSTADTIKIVYYKKYTEFKDLPSCTLTAITTMIDYLLAPLDKKWSIINLYNATILPQAIDEDREVRGLPDKWDMTVNNAQSPFHMSDKYGE